MLFLSYLVAMLLATAAALAVSYNKNQRSKKRVSMAYVNSICKLYLIKRCVVW